MLRPNLRKGVNTSTEKNGPLGREVEGAGGGQPRKSRKGETTLGPGECPLHLYSNITCLFAKPSGSAPKLLHKVLRTEPYRGGGGGGAGEWREPAVTWQRGTAITSWAT